MYKTRYENLLLSYMDFIVTQNRAFRNWLHTYNLFHKEKTLISFLLTIRIKIMFFHY